MNSSEVELSDFFYDNIIGWLINETMRWRVEYVCSRFSSDGFLILVNEDPNSDIDKEYLMKEQSLRDALNSSYDMHRAIDVYLGRYPKTPFITCGATIGQAAEMMQSNLQSLCNGNVFNYKEFERQYEIFEIFRTEVHQVMMDETDDGVDFEYRIKKLLKEVENDSKSE